MKETLINRIRIIIKIKKNKKKTKIIKNKIKK